MMQKSCMCNFLYGSETNEHLTSQMQMALDERREFKTEIVLYKKSGRTVWLQDTVLTHKNPDPFTSKENYGEYTTDHTLPFNVKNL